MKISQGVVVLVAIAALAVFCVSSEHVATLLLLTLCLFRIDIRTHSGAVFQTEPLFEGWAAAITYRPDVDKTDVKGGE